MVHKAIGRLEHLCEAIPPVLTAFAEAEFSRKPAPNKWSKKEILGHLIDSACNNHQRFVRVQFQDAPSITYDQDKWNNFSYHNKMDGKQMITFWQLYNKQLAALARQIPKELLRRPCNVGEKENVNLGYLITDYVVHLEHHLREICEYE